MRKKNWLRDTNFNNLQNYGACVISNPERGRKSPDRLDSRRSLWGTSGASRCCFYLKALTLKQRRRGLRPTFRKIDRKIIHNYFDRYLLKQKTPPKIFQLLNTENLLLLFWNCKFNICAFLLKMSSFIVLEGPVCRKIILILSAQVRFYCGLTMDQKGKWSTINWNSGLTIKAEHKQ